MAGGMSEYPDREWLEALKKHQYDPAWLSEHADIIFSTVQSGINKEQRFFSAFELLAEGFQCYVLKSGDNHPWERLLYDALLIALSHKNKALQVRALKQMGEQHIKNGKRPSAQHVFERIYAHAETEEDIQDEIRLIARIGQIKTQYLSLDDTVDADLIDDALSLARRVDNPQYYAELYQALALTFTFRRDAVLSVIYGQMAFLYWLQVGNQIEIGRSLYRLAVAYNVAQKLDRADSLLKLARDYFRESQYSRQYALLPYEQASIYLKQGSYDLAALNYSIALQEFEELNEPFHATMAQHALAVAQVQLKQLDAARQNLNEVLDGWTQLKNWPELARGLHALAYLEFLEGQRQPARDYLARALVLCREMPDVPARHELEKLIVETQVEVG